MSYRRNKPIWSEAFELLAEAERLQRQYFHTGSAHHPTWEPPVDMLETADELVITVALPGVSPERVEVHLSGGQLIISGMRPLPHNHMAGVRIHHLELPYGCFERRIPLPAGNYELTSHGLLHGCLQLNLLKIH